MAEGRYVPFPLIKCSYCGSWVETICLTPGSRNIDDYVMVRHSNDGKVCTGLGKKSTEIVFADNARKIEGQNVAESIVH